MHESEKEDKRGESHGLIWVCEDQASSLQSIHDSPILQPVARRMGGHDPAGRRPKGG